MQNFYIFHLISRFYDNQKVCVPRDKHFVKYETTVFVWLGKFISG